MAVILFDEQHQGRPGSFGLEKIELKREFRVETDDKNDDSVDIIAALFLDLGLRPGVPHPSIATCILETINCDPIGQSDDAHNWKLVLNYSTQSRRIRENPLDDQPSFFWESDGTQIPFIRDSRTSVGVTNSAHDPFDPPPTRDSTRRKVIVKRNLAFVPSWVLDFEDRVNEFAFSLGILGTYAVLPEQAKMGKVTVTETQERNGIEFIIVTFSMDLKKNGWTSEYLDQGFREIDVLDSTKRIEILVKDSSGELVQPSTPRLLDGFGLLLQVDLENPVFLSYNKYSLADFNDLPIFT